MCTCVLARCPQPRHHMRERVPKCALPCTLPLPRAGDMVPFAPAGRRHGAVAGCAMRASTPTNSMISAITLHHRLHCGWTRQVRSRAGPPAPARAPEIWSGAAHASPSLCESRGWTDKTHACSATLRLARHSELARLRQAPHQARPKPSAWPSLKRNSRA